MKIIGITGKSGSGKSTLTQVLSKKINCNTVNVDVIGHKATSNENIIKKLCKIFGKQILNDDEKIDRKKLGNIVFSDKKKMDILTEVTWGYMQEILDEILEKELGEYIILEWALLPISKYWEKCNTKILIQAEYEERKNRVMQRDKISEEYFLKRDSGCIDYTPYTFEYKFKNDYTEKTMDDFANEIRSHLEY